MVRRRNMNKIEELEEAYCVAANALTRYRHENGFEPGARVVTRYREEPEKNGVIAEYGEVWNGSGLHIPVKLDTGILQPWPLSQLRLAAQSSNSRISNTDSK